MPQSGPTHGKEGHNREHVATTCGDVVGSQIEKLRKVFPEVFVTRIGPERLFSTREIIVRTGGLILVGIFARRRM